MTPKDHADSLLSIIEAQGRTIRLQASHIHELERRVRELRQARPPGVYIPPPGVELREATALPVEEISDEISLSMQREVDVPVRLLTPEERAAKEAEFKRAEDERLARNPPRVTPKPHVYFVQAGPQGPVKVGWSKDPKKRMAQLQTGHAEPLTLLACAVGTQRDETRLHERFTHLRMSGEWFRPGDDLMSYIKTVAEKRVL